MTLLYSFTIINYNSMTGNEATIQVQEYVRCLQWKRKMTIILQENINISRVVSAFLIQVLFENKTDAYLTVKSIKIEMTQCSSQIILALLQFGPWNQIGFLSEAMALLTDLFRLNTISSRVTSDDHIAVFRAKVEDGIPRINCCIIVAEDFNAKALEWGTAEPDSREKYII